MQIIGADAKPSCEKLVFFSIKSGEIKAGEGRGLLEIFSGICKEAFQVVQLELRLCLLIVHGDSVICLCGLAGILILQGEIF